MNSKCDQLPVGLIVQLLEHYTIITTVEDVYDHCSYIQSLSSCENKASNKFRLEQDLSPQPLGYRRGVLPIEPYHDASSPLGAGHYVSLCYTHRW